MTKEEKIKEAYGKHWETVKEYVNENGEVSMIIDGIFVTPKFLDLGFSREFVEKNIKSWYDSSKNIHFWQFKSLQGIENNNCWIKIESEEDLPKFELCMFIPLDRFEDSFCGWYDSKSGEVYFIDSEYYKINEYSYIKLNSWLPNQITHYQLIIKPEPPIY